MNTLRKAVAILGIALMVAPSASAFDTFWHSAATGAAARAYSFSPDATNILQFGNFGGPDFFGPLYDSVLGERFENIENNPKIKATLQEFFGYRAKFTTVRKSAIFMHFDDLNGAVTSNVRFDSLFVRLLKNTQKTLAEYKAAPNMTEGYRKIAILETLGASLHMVQDFYSHSNWTHQDFAKLGMPNIRMPWGKDRAPTWFEVKAKLGDPSKWPFQVKSGRYPPQGAGIYSHSHMNHDNSQLVYEEAETPGTPRNPQVQYHTAGPFPADTVGVKEHQLFAVNTAAGASIEWVKLVEEDAAAKAAIDFAKDWDVKKFNPAMLHDLEGALASTLLLSCAVHKWDGFEPIKQRQTQCDAMLSLAPISGVGAVILPGYSGVLPTVLNEFWAAFVKFNIIEHLAAGIGSQAGDYIFTN